MATTDFDPKTLSVEERLALIDRLWISILEDAGRGDELATQALDMDHGLDPEVITELERRADELERDPSKGIPWEDFLEELRRKRE
jgi:putative addiction module component (TIGR02574 family)